MSQQKTSIGRDGAETTPSSRREFLARAGQAAVVPPTVALVVSADSKPADAKRRYKMSKDERREARAAKREELRARREARRAARDAESASVDEAGKDED